MMLTKGLGQSVASSSSSSCRRRTRSVASSVASGPRAALRGSQHGMRPHGSPRPLVASSSDRQPPRYMVLTTAQAESAGGDNGKAKIKIIGVGGGGGNAINRMIEAGLKGELWVVNTDSQVLAQHLCPNRMQIGIDCTRGLGAGGNPEIGRVAAQESADGLRKLVAGSDLVFVTAGMGGGTGTGAAPVVAQLSKESGGLTVGVVTFPFTFEGRRRRAQAMAGITALKACVDCVIVIPNDKLLETSAPGTSLNDAFRQADDVLLRGVQGITDIITTPGIVNIDYADIRTVITNSGTAMLGQGSATGPNRAEEAALMAVQAPLLLDSVEHATGILYNITAGPDLTLAEVGVVSDVITRIADDNAHVFFGTVNDERYAGELQVTLIATGFPENFEEQLLNSAAGSSSSSSSAKQQRQAAAAPPPAAAAGGDAGGRGAPGAGRAAPWQKRL